MKVVTVSLTNEVPTTLLDDTVSNQIDRLRIANYVNTDTFLSFIVDGQETDRIKLGPRHFLDAETNEALDKIKYAKRIDVIAVSDNLIDISLTLYSRPVLANQPELI